MALMVPCPNCGRRPFTEFWCGGELPEHAPEGLETGPDRLEAEFQRVWLRRNAAGPQTERWLLTSDARLPAQVLKVAHHGGRYSSTPRFLSAVAPKAAVISVGAVNEYGHPTPETIARLEQQRARVYRTDRDGTVTVETDGTRIQVTTAAGKREILVAR